MCVDESVPPFSFVLIEGTAEISDDLDAMLPWSTAIGGRYMGSDQAERFGRRNAVAGELLVRVRPTHFVAALGDRRLMPAKAVLDLDALMEVTLEEARAAIAHDDVPIGAVVARVDTGEIIARRHNERELTNDPTAHAEVLALRDAAQVVGSWRLATACSSQPSSRARCARAPRSRPRADRRVRRG